MDANWNEAFQSAYMELGGLGERVLGTYTTAHRLSPKWHYVCYIWTTHATWLLSVPFLFTSHLLICSLHLYHHKHSIKYKRASEP